MLKPFVRQRSVAMARKPRGAVRAEALEGRRLLTVFAQVSGPAVVPEGQPFAVTLSAAGTEASAVSGYEVNWGDGSALEAVPAGGGAPWPPATPSRPA